MPRRSVTAEGPTVNQISVYLLRADVDDVEAALRDPASLDRYELAAEGGVVGRLYLKPAVADDPSWMALLDSITVRRLPGHKNQHVSAVLFLQREDRYFALTFGFGRHLLEWDALEPDFGLKVAAGLVDPEQLSVVDSRLVQATRLQVRRQAGRGTTPRNIGLDIGREMLRALSGRTLDGTLGTRVTGADALGLAAKLGIAGITDRLDVFRAAHDEKRYRERFPLLDRWQPVTDRRLLAELDDAVVGALALMDRKLDLAVPEIIEWRGAGFSFTGGARNERHAFPDLDAYLSLRDGPPSLADIRRERMTLHAADADTPIASWKIHQALEWDTRIGERVYFLAEGRWFEVAADFLARVDARLAEIDLEGVSGPDFDPREWEEDYNARLARHAPGRALLDAQFEYFEDESGKVEICDVLTAERDFVHVKRDFRTAAVSLQFAQGLVSADLFINRTQSRERLRDLLKERAPDLVGVIPTGIPEPRSFRVAYGIITTEPERVPLDLPVFARIHLGQVADVIERLGMRITVFGIATTVGARPAELGPTAKELADEQKRKRQLTTSTATIVGVNE